MGGARDTPLEFCDGPAPRREPSGVTALVERTRCPSCGGGASSTLHSRPFAHPSVWSGLQRRYPGRLRRTSFASRRYEVARCDLCQLLFQRFVPCDASLARLYGAWNPDPPRPARAERMRLSGALPERILDLGAGDSRFCTTAHAAGCQVVAVDIAEERLATLRAQGIEAHRSVEDAPADGFGLVRCHQIVEHLPRPYETLRTLTDRLAPGGRLELCVPDATGCAKALQRPFWNAADSVLRPLEHLNGFTLQALRVLERRLELARMPAAPAPWNRRGQAGLLWLVLERPAAGRRAR